MVSKGTQCARVAPWRSKVRVIGGTACGDSACWSKSPLQAGCLLTQLLRSSLKDVLCKHGGERKAWANISRVALPARSAWVCPRCGLWGSGEKVYCRDVGREDKHLTPIQTPHWLCADGTATKLNVKHLNHLQLLPVTFKKSHLNVDWPSLLTLINAHTFHQYIVVAL